MGLFSIYYQTNCPNCNNSVYVRKELCMSHNKINVGEITKVSRFNGAVRKHPLGDSLFNHYFVRCPNDKEVIMLTFSTNYQIGPRHTEKINFENLEMNDKIKQTVLEHILVGEIF